MCSDYADKLIPRAVGYSAGLLNYFFRGQINLIPDETTGSGYVIVNNGHVNENYFYATFQFGHLDGDQDGTGTQNKLTQVSLSTGQVRTLAIHLSNVNAICSAGGYAYAIVDTLLAIENNDEIRQVKIVKIRESDFTIVGEPPYFGTADYPYGVLYDEASEIDVSPDGQYVFGITEFGEIAKIKATDMSIVNRTNIGGEYTSIKIVPK